MPTTMLAAFFALTACTTAPVAEVRAFRDGARAIEVAATPILDDLAVVERRVGVATVVNEAKARTPDTDCARHWFGDPDAGFVNSFCLKDAGYFSRIGDPPATAKLRHGLATLNAFSLALAALIENANGPDAQAEVGRLAAELSGLADAVAVPILGASLPAVVTALQPIVAQLLALDNMRRAREIILEHHDNVIVLIEALKNAASAIFQIHALDVTRSITGPPPMAEELRKERIAGLEGQRRLLADYITLLDRSAASWQALVLAAQSKTSTISLTVLADSAAAARADAEAVRRARAAIRLNTAP